METIKNTMKTATGKDAQTSQSQSQFEKGKFYSTVFTVLLGTNHTNQVMKFPSPTNPPPGNNII